MKKYRIVNEELDQIICRPKNGGRHYRQSISAIQPELIPVCTTVGRAQKEADFLNKEYYEGWAIEEVDNEE